MYWNKDLFETAGLDPETPPATWEEWETMAAQITDESKNVYGSGISYDYAYQIAHIIQRFGRLAAETGKAMKQIDPNIELIVCGSSLSSAPPPGS